MQPIDAVPAWQPDEGADHAVALFRARFDADPDGVWASPGRVNLIGEHVDYNGGLCLPLALPHATYAAVRLRDDDQVRVVSELAPDDVWTGRLADIAPGVVPAWVAYAAGPAWALWRPGGPLADAPERGFDLAVASCVPLGAGLSSSAAIECATALALDELHEAGLALTDPGRARLADACVLAENEVAGAPTGGMDQAVSLRATEGHALLLDCRDGSASQLPLDLPGAGLALLVIDTRVHHSLADGQYGRRRAACQAAAQRLGVATLREVTDLEAALAALDDPEQIACVRHVVTEIDRVRDVAELASAGRLRDLGRALGASHASLRDDYRVSCPELDAAVAVAVDAGALGARMTGGGFGGSALALVDADRVEPIAAAVRDAFAAQGFVEPGFLVAVPSAGGHRVR